jgi:hypothetical protein
LAVLGDYDVEGDDDGKAASSTAVSSSTGSIPDTAMCLTRPTHVGCLECMIGELPLGSAQHQACFEQQCLCANECASLCIDECAGAYPYSNTCVDCITALSSQDACVAGWDACCFAQPECAQYRDAFMSCP